MRSTDIEPDSRLAKLCSYCSSIVSDLDDVLRRIEQGESYIEVETPPEFWPWIAAAENGCEMCSSFLDGLRSFQWRGDLDFQLEFLENDIRES
jgi:hypothetical protein